MMKETRTLEFKEQITNTFLKTVSAYANYGDGKIIFGVADDGSSKPIADLKKTCIDVENRINDSITPHVDFCLDADENTGTIILTVKEGKSKPYLYKAKAYKRNDTATIEVDSLELTRLVLEGKNIKFESLPSREQDLTFTYLEKQLKKVLGIETFDLDTLKTLSLYFGSSGFSNAANILSDQNCFPGIDIAKFGETINIIKKRITLVNKSALEEFEESVSVYKDFYQYEEIKGKERKTVQLIPEEAFREAVANAVIHRAWDIDANIRIVMHDDSIQVISPGGLPSGLSQEEYLNGRISVLRNPTLANVFYRLNIVEIFGTGVLRIQKCYENSAKKPLFEISENAISVTLPVIKTAPDLPKDFCIVYEKLSRTTPKSISEITALVPFGKSKTGEILTKLVHDGYAKTLGKGRGTKYCL